MRDHKACYGKLYPSVAMRRSDADCRSAAFKYVVRQPGTVALPPSLTVDLAGWDRCVECAEFPSCRQLSAAKILLGIAAGNN